MEYNFGSMTNRMGKFCKLFSNGLCNKCKFQITDTKHHRAKIPSFFNYINLPLRKFEL